MYFKLWVNYMIIHLQDSLAELVLKKRVCDGDTLRSLGIGSSLLTFVSLVPTALLTTLNNVDTSDSKAQITGKLSRTFRRLNQLGETRNQLEQFRYT